MEQKYRYVVWSTEYSELQLDYGNFETPEEAIECIKANEHLGYWFIIVLEGWR